MNTTIPTTFDGYLARYFDRGVPEGFLAEHEAELREQHTRELLAQKLHPAPADMPPCPSWCTSPAGHEYDSVAHFDAAAGTLSLLRSHSDREMDGGSVSQDEYLRDGVVILDEPVILAGGDLEPITADEARKHAASLLNLADRLDQIAASTRTCPQSSAHGPHSWASMVEGQPWHCPGSAQ